MIKVSDYIAQTLVRHGIEHIFLVTGGGAMHLNDAIGRCEGLKYVCCHHEQACAMAAESYYRLTNRLAAVNVTTGPGGTNAITGVWGAWTDSIGMIVISGQVKWETVVRSTDLPLRQLGDQELDIVKVVAPMTKYAEMVTDPQTIRYHLEKALYLAKAGRPGPVWLDIPMNVQGASVDPETLPSFDPAEMPPVQDDTARLPQLCEQIARMCLEAKRPVIMAGSGVRLAGAQPELVALAERWGIPIVTAWNAHDLVPNSHPGFSGRPGSIGDRAGNFAVQNADFLLVLGSRLNVRQVSYNWENFAHRAYKVIVDIDPAELKKPTLAPDLPIQANVADVLHTLLGQPARPVPAQHSEWLAWCRERVQKYPVTLPEYWESENGVNPYCFMDALFSQLPEGQIVVTGDGTACVTSFQAASIKPGQRLYTNSGCASMGYDLPAAVGAAFGSGGKQIVCLAGDGSIQMNLAELQTIALHKLPIKLFVLNNQGYHSIRQTQQNYFPDNLIGCGPDSGLFFAPFDKLADACGFGYHAARTSADLEDALRETLAGEGPQMCEVFLDLGQQFAPKVSSRKLDDGRMVTAPLEDMAPFLSREELASNLITDADGDEQRRII